MINLKKGGKKWIYGVCLYSILLVFSVVGSLLITTKNTSALRHDINSLPLLSECTNPTNVNQPGSTGCGNPHFQIRWNSSNLPVNLPISDPSNVYYFTSRVSNNKCTFVLNSDHYYNTPNFIAHDNGDRSFDFGLDSYRFDYGYNAPGLTTQCLQGVPFGQLYSSQSNIGLHPSFDDSSLVNIPPLDRINYTNLSPYYFSYSGMYRYHSITSDGVDYTHTLKLSDITYRSASKAYRLVIPLGMNQSDITGQIITGRNLTYTGQFNFNSSFAWRSDIGSNLQFNLNWVAFDSSDISNNTNHSGSVPCSIRNVSLGEEKVVQFTCSFDSPLTVEDGQFWAWLYINDASSQYLWEYDGDLTFAVAYLTTDFDDTPGDPIGREVVGNFAYDAPGSAYRDIPNTGSFIDQFNNLFHFSVVNPLQPIFESFTHSNSCVSIPILAGMLNTDQDEYCPIFNSTLRGIVTPVFSLLAVFMVFFFFVRWLNSSTGNDFVDSGGKK